MLVVFDSVILLVGESESVGGDAVLVVDDFGVRAYKDER